MEVWILLAAAGSGYLSRRWQNAPQSKPPSPPSSPSVTSLEKEEGSRWQGHSFVTPKGCGRNKLPLGKEFAVRRRSNRLKTSNPNPQVKAEEEVSTSLFGSFVTEENGRRDCHNFANTPPSLECHPQCSFSSKEEKKLLSGDKLLEAQRLNRSGKRGNGGVGEFVEGKEVGFGKRLKDSPIKTGGEEEERDGEDLIPSIQTKEVLDMKGALEEEVMSVGNLMTCLWDMSQFSFSDGLFLDSTSQQKSGARSSSRGPGSRRSKTPNKFGRKNAIRPKKILSSSVSKPMSSLESCLSAQLLQDTEKSAKRDRAHLLSHSLNGSERHLNFTGHQCNETPTSQLKTLMEIKDSRYGGGSLEECSSSSSPPSLEICGHAENKMRACTSLGKRALDKKDGSQVISSSESLALQGHESILFNFGVGVGMMFAANSYRNEMKAVMDALEQMEGLLKDIGTEANVSDVEIIQLKNESDQNWKQDGALNTWTKVRSLFEVLKTSVHLKLKKEISLTSDSRDMKKLEAELETELERINIIDLHPRSFFELSSRFEVTNKVEVGNVICGELSMDKIPLGESVELEEGGSCSSDDEVLPNYAVPPQELERRLYRVLEARHEERIAELEAELYGFRQKLQGKEKELLWWKEHIGHSRDVTCYDDIVSTENDYGMKGDKGFPLHQSTLSSNERCNSIEGTLESVREALDADDEACDEFLRVLSDDSEGEVLRTDAMESDANGKRLFPIKSLVIMPNNKPLPDTSKVALTDIYVSGRGGSFLSSKSFNLVEDNASNDTPATSTPCSIKLIDASMPTMHLSRSSPSYGLNTHSPSWDEEDLLCGVESYFLTTTTTDEHLPPFSLNHPPNPLSNTDSVASIRSKYWDPEDSLIGDFESLGVFDDDEEEDDTSDSDEHMGIIKRIVEKARKGSPIVQEARTALSALEQTD